MASNRLYVVGHPVAHSKSPVMHNALYKHMGLDWRYELMDIEDGAKADQFLSSGDFLGVNITMPFKGNAFEIASKRHPSAVLAQGANVLLKNKDGELVCFNMDGLGCVRYLQSKGVRFVGSKVVVCGTGPTSLAIMHAAAMAEAMDVVLLGRDSAKAQAVLDGYLERLNSTPDAAIVERCRFSAGSYQEKSLAIVTAEVVIDATPLGMNQGDPAPFDIKLLGENQSVFDVVYGHGETTLIAAAKKAGCRVIDGSGMLVSQAVLGAWEFMKSAGVSQLPSYDEAFSIMAKAAGFDC